MAVMGSFLLSVRGNMDGSSAVFPVDAKRQIDETTSSVSLHPDRDGRSGEILCVASLGDKENARKQLLVFFIEILENHIIER